MPKSLQPSAKTSRPRVGIPWRTEKQERAQDLRYNEKYLDSVRAAGGDPVQISLLHPPAKLASIAKSLDAFVLPGSPADIEPKLYGEPPHAKASKPDPKREATDFAILDHALSSGKPVLAICYGIQSLNVHCGGSLYQDIPGEMPHALIHSSKSDRKDAMHEIRITGGHLAMLAGKPKIKVNSVHHQSIRRPGKGLRVAAVSPDGVIEAVEWMRGPGWALGVQWHPERTPKDPLAQQLFGRLVFEAAIARIARKNPPKRHTTRVTGNTPNKKRKSGRTK